MDDLLQGMRGVVWIAGTTREINLTRWLCATLRFGGIHFLPVFGFEIYERDSGVLESSFCITDFYRICSSPWKHIRETRWKQCNEAAS